MKKRYIFVILGVITTFLFMPTAMADNSRAGVNFDDSGIAISVDTFDFGTIDVTSLQNNNDNKQFFMSEFGHLKFYQGNAKLVAKDQRFDTRMGFKVTASSDGKWYNNEQEVAGVNQLALVMQEPNSTEFNFLFDGNVVDVMPVDDSFLGQAHELNFDYASANADANHINFGIFVPKFADVSNLKSKQLTTSVTWTVTNTPS